MDLLHLPLRCVSSARVRSSVFWPCVSDGPFDGLVRPARCYRFIAVDSNDTSPPPPPLTTTRYNRPRRMRAPSNVLVDRRGGGRRQIVTSIDNVRVVTLRKSPLLPPLTPFQPKRRVTRSGWWEGGREGVIDLRTERREADNDEEARRRN